MANPFLMSDMEVGDTQVSSSNGSFNPFLSGGMDFSATEHENPFMSTFTATNVNTNPFAFTGDDNSSSSSPFFSAPETLANTATQMNVQTYDNIFSTPDTSQVMNEPVNDFFGGFTNNATQPQSTPAVPSYSSARSSVDHTASLMDNVSLFGSDPLDMPRSRDGSGASTPKGAPRRPPPPGGPSHGPPPPRPGLPPSKETKDLILSVTGAMEATSSHLLDRLQATRTPSPTPIRDLNSPSPTPDMFGDLLGVGVDDVHTGPSQTQPVVQEVNLLGDMEDDFLSSTTLMQPSNISPIAPVPQSMPPIIPLVPTAKIPSVPPEIPVSPSAQVPSVPTVVPITTTAQVPPMPPMSTSHPPRPVPPRPPERPKAPPPVPAMQENIMQLNTFDQTKVPDTASVGTMLVEKPNDINDFDFRSPPVQETQSARPSEPELDFSQVHIPVEETPVIETEVIAPTTFPSMFETPVTAVISEPEQALSLEEQPVMNGSTPDTAFYNSAYEDTRQETPYPSSPYEPQNNAFDDSSFASGFDSEMNITVREVSPATTDNSFDNNSVFGSINKQSNDMFFNNTGSSFQPQPDDLFAPAETVINTTPVAPLQPLNIFGDQGNKPVDDFDAFSAKFESAGQDDYRHPAVSADAFNDAFSSSQFGVVQSGGASMGFEADDSFDSFLAAQEPPAVPQSTPSRFSRAGSADSDENDKDFNIFIKPKQVGDFGAPGGAMPVLAPPPSSTLQDSSPRFNPFDKSQDLPAQVTDNIFAQAAVLPESDGRGMERTDSQETPPTPLFDEDVSQPLEPFPRIHYTGLGWEMHLRHPNKKKITGQRFWKKVFIRLVYQGENPVLQLLNNKDDKDPFQELPLQPCYSVSDIGAQQYDQYGKIFTVKLQFIFYKERPGVRPGQVSKAERITNKLSQFASYAIQGDYQGVKEFGSDLKKLGLPVEHAPQISQLFKIGSQNFEDMKQFSVCIEEALFRLPAHRDRALNYKMEEVQITAVDELYVDQNSTGGIIRQIARVRLFFLGFLSGMPDIELGVNDLVRQGKEVVGRHDIIPVVTEEWIRLEVVEFHSCVQQDEYERTRTIKFKPPDACYIELMRFRVRPPRNRELPLQLRTTMCITGNKVDLKADVLVPGFSSRKLGQIPCEDVMIRFPIPECWIYLFRVEKHFRYGSVKSAHRRSGKVKGLERFLGTVDNLEPQLMEATSGQAKYEHQHRAIVWRMPRLPKEGQGAYTSHSLVCHMALTSFDQIPETLEKYCYVEFTMPITQVSHTTVRSVSICNSDSDQPPEKYVRQLARHEYKVEIEFTQGEGPGDYIAATKTAPTPAPIPEEPRATPATPAAASDSDSSS